MGEDAYSAHPQHRAADKTHDEAAWQVRIAFVVRVRRQFRCFAEFLERFLFQGHEKLVRTSDESEPLKRTHSSLPTCLGRAS